MSETGRRSAAARAVSPTAVIAVLLPLLTIGALALVRPDVQAGTRDAPQQVRADRTDLVCPTPLGDPAVAVAADAGAAGRTTWRSPDTEPAPVDLAGTGVARLESPEVVFLRGAGDVASSLIGTRLQGEGLAASECVLPRSEYWFTGLGAGAEHASVLELSNPDDGPAVADVTVWSGSGPIDAPHVRGLIVPGGETMRLDLAEEVPRRTELAVRVVVSRGRLAATVEDELRGLGSEPDSRGWLPESAAPTTDQLLLGLVRGEGSDTVVLSNPGADEARVELRIVTDDAAFVPEGLREVRVGAGSVETVTLTQVLRDQVADGALGLQVVSTEPVAATLRSVVEDDLVHAPPVTGSAGPMTAPVPAGDAQLVLARAGGAGVAVVAAYNGKERLSQERVELREGSGGRVDLPEGTRLVRVTPGRTDVAASVVVTGDGATVVPLGELVRRALVPGVRPGLPYPQSSGER